LFLYKQYSLTFGLTAIRASDVMLVLIIFYGLAFTLLPTLSPAGTLVLHFSHALAWCIIHYFGLGLLLRAQSKHKFLVRHYLKNYHYSKDDGGQSAVVEAFANWKIIYNLSMCMTYGRNQFILVQRMIMFTLPFQVSCFGIVWKSYLIPRNWTVGNELLFHILGAVCDR
jgi:phosphatidylethanolamine N-methyltransferase